MPPLTNEGSIEVIYGQYLARRHHHSVSAKEQQICLKLPPLYVFMYSSTTEFQTPVNSHFTAVKRECFIYFRMFISLHFA